MFDNVGAVYPPTVTLTIRARTGCAFLDENAPITLNGVRGRVHNNPLWSPEDYPGCTPFVELEYQRPANGAEDGILDFGDGRFLVMQNLVASRGWTREGVLVDEIAAGAGDLIVLTWTPASDRLDAEAAFDSYSDSWSGRFPVEGNTVSLLVPQAGDLALPTTLHAHQGFAPPISQCEGLAKCPELIAAGVSGRWARHLTVLPVTP